jgi:hypothetical protein
VAQDLTIKLIAQNDHILTVARKELLIGISRIPDPGLAHEIEPGAIDNGSAVPRISAEENRGPKDSLEGADKAAILRTALLHAKCV